MALSTDRTRPRWNSVLVAELDRVAARDRWGRALIAIGALHLAGFLGCQLLAWYGDRSNWHYVLLWTIELLGVTGAANEFAGKGWHKSTPLAGLIARVWTTFLILCFNLASMNTLMGLEHDWFKPALTTLSIFGFAMMAWLVDVRFFALAVWMYFTGLLMVQFPAAHYGIYAISWFLVLALLGAWLRWRAPLALKRRELAPTVVVDPPTPTPPTPLRTAIVIKRRRPPDQLFRQSAAWLGMRPSGDESIWLSEK